MSLCRFSSRLICSVIVGALVVGFGFLAVGCGSIQQGLGRNPAPTSQTISGFGPFQNQPLSTTSTPATLTLSATASSGLPVSFSATADSTGICSVSGATVTLLAIGTCTVQADQAGNNIYAPAPSIGQSFVVTADAQTITFGTISSQLVGAQLTLSATASSGLQVTYSASTASAGICTVAGPTVTMVAIGTCTIQANQAGNITYAAAPEVSQSFAVLGETQTIVFPIIQSVTLATTPITVPLGATATSFLPITYTSLTPLVCTVTNSATTPTVNPITIGTCTVEADQAGNAQFAPAPPSTRSFIVNGIPQTITFTGTYPTQSLSTTATPTTVPLTATATSGLAVTFSTGSPSICTVSVSTATLIGPGTCVILANQAGNSTWAPALEATQNFTVNGEPQTITFPGPIAAQVVNTPLTLTGAAMASSSSGLAITYVSVTPTVCSVPVATTPNFNFAASGTCTILATQTGNATYAAAKPVPQSFAVAGQPQTITFTSTPSTQTLSSTATPTTVTLAANATSGLTVTFSSGSTSVCTVSGTTATLIADGNCVILANQAGNLQWAPAPQATQTFIVNGESQTISFNTIPTQTVGGFLLLTPFASANPSGLAITFISDTPAICSVTNPVAGPTAAFTASGTCTIVATQPGNSTYAPAVPVAQSFTVNGITQVLTFAPIANQHYGAPPIPISATTGAPASANLIVSFVSLTPDFCSVSNNGSWSVTLLQPTGTSSCSIEAVQAGNSQYAAASVTQSFTILAPSQTITFANPGAQTLNIPPAAAKVIALVATAGSGLTVSFDSTTTTVCTVSGTNATLLTAGTCTIEAKQAGNGTTIAAAPTVAQSFTVAAAQSITFTAISSPQTLAAPPALTTATLSATSTSGLTVSFESTTPTTCTVSGSTATFIAIGSCTIEAIQDGNAVYAPASSSQTVTVDGAAQSITFTAPAATGSVGTTVALTATASSGLPVTFSTVSAACTVTGTQATLTANGACVISANQAGNSIYAAAPQVQKTITASTAAGVPPGTLSYSTNPAEYTQGTAITPNILTNTGGGTGITYSINIPLPAGLNFSTTTGDITGTPTAAAATATYIVTATNIYGSSSVNLILTVGFKVATPGDYGYTVPSPEPALPAYFDTFTPPLYTINANAPAVAEWTRTAAPSNATEFSLVALTTDTRFTLYGQTGVAETTPATVTPVIVDTNPAAANVTAGQIATLIVPGATSQGMLLAWPTNTVGVGDPVAINRTEAWWAGPLTATVGDTVSVFGRNLTYPGTTSAGSTPPLVYLTSTNGGSDVTVTVTAANPYKVDFSTGSIAAGTYNIWIHNGAGGHFGWSEVLNDTSATPTPAVLTISATSPWNCQNSGASSFNVQSASYSATGDGVTDDTNAISNAILAAGNYASNASHPYATVYFPGGTYMINTGIQPPSNVCFLGAGTSGWQTQSGAGSASILRLSRTNATCSATPASSVESNGAFIWANEGVNGGGSNNVEFSDMVLDANGNIPCLTQLNSDGSTQIATQGTQIRFRNEHNAKFDHIVLNGTGAAMSWLGGSGFNSFDFSNGQNYYLTNSTIVGAGIENSGTSQVFVHDNSFWATDNSGMMIDNSWVTQTGIWNNTQEDLEYYNTTTAPGNPIPYNGGSCCGPTSLVGVLASTNNPGYPANPQYVTNVGPYGLGRIGGSESYETGLLYIGQNTNVNAGPCDPTNTSGTYPNSYPGCLSTNDNSGEQILFETPGTDYGGFAADDSTATTVDLAGVTSSGGCIYDSKSDCTGREAIIVGGKGLGQNRHIVAQSGDVLTVSPPWLVTPDHTSRVYVGNATYQVAVYNNIEQGKADYVNRSTSLAGVEPWGNVYALVYDSNQVSNVATGINDATLQEGGNSSASWIVPNYFNLFANNTIKGAYTGIRIADNTYYGAGNAGDSNAVSFVGDIFRNNTLGTAETTSPTNSGIIYTGINFSPCDAAVCQTASVTYSGGDTIQGVVLDNNTVVVNPYNYAGLYSKGPANLQVPSGLWTDAGPAPIIDTLLNNNSFTMVTTSGYTSPSYGLEFGQGNLATPTQPATTGNSCVETGSNSTTGFATASYGLTCTGTINK